MLSNLTEIHCLYPILKETILTNFRLEDKKMFKNNLKIVIKRQKSLYLTKFTFKAVMKLLLNISDIC